MAADSKRLRVSNFYQFYRDNILLDHEYMSNFHIRHNRIKWWHYVKNFNGEKIVNISAVKRRSYIDTVLFQYDIGNKLI